MADTKKVLLVEDEPSHQLVITKALSGFYDFIVAGSYQEARDKLNEGQYDMFLLDIMLGDGLGFDLVYDIRSHESFKATPIIFLTSRDDIQSKVKGFSLGAQDYVTKPCDPRELRARIDSKFLNNPVTPVASEFAVQNLKFSFENQAVYMIHSSGQQEQLDLTPIEYKLLYYFARHTEQALSREEILKQVWGENTHVMVRSVDTYVAALRKKTKTYGVQIKSVHGIGYRLQFSKPQKMAS